MIAAAALPLRAHQEIEDALARLNAAITAAPDDAELYLTRGELYAQHEEFLTAEANYLRAAELSPRLPRLALAQGRLALAQQHLTEARSHLDRALALDPRDAEALIVRARAHFAGGDRGRAIADYTAALALLPQPRPELFLERAAYFPAPADALRSLDEGIARLGPVHTLQRRALALEESLGRIEAALARIDEMMAQTERRETWLKHRGDVLARAGRHAEARAAYALAMAEIAALPDWLRDSPATQQLATELARLGSPAS
ncbi:MAG TPA: tetratricopeptide repeat protein [Opitutaceae bacterium]|nr:tetratricopeptide repeat protein [Opitutaceae bacterium]